MISIKSALALLVALILTVFVMLAAAVTEARAQTRQPAASQTQPATKAPVKNKAEVLLATYDANHNARLDTEEIRRIAQLEPNVAKQLKPCDLDRNNILDREELALWAKTSGK